MSLSGSLGDWFSKVPIIIDQKVLERMSKGGSQEIDIFLMREIYWLRKFYIQTGHPRIIYFAGSKLADIVAPIPGCNCSFQFSQLQALLAEMILAQGQDANSLHVAVNHLEFAFEILNRVQVMSSDVLRAHINNALLLGIARKAFGEMDDSFNGIQKTVQYLKWEKSATELDLIPLHRQETIMRQTVDGHKQLADNAVKYIVHNPQEYYRSVKRVFEFLLNKGRLKEAELYYKEFNRAFAAIAHQAPAISQISFLKNVGQFFMAKGKAKDAASIFKRVLFAASNLSLQGQARQVKLLLQELEAGNKQAELITFKIG